MPTKTAPRQEIRFTVPLTPPSVNAYVRHSRGRHYLSKEALAFKHAVSVYSRGQQLSAAFYAVEIDVFYGKGERGDLDNRAKLPLDALQEARVIESDARVIDLHLRKHRDELHPRTEIRVTEKLA